MSHIDSEPDLTCRLYFGDPCCMAVAGKKTLSMSSYIFRNSLSRQVQKDQQIFVKISCMPNTATQYKKRTLLHTKAIKKITLRYNLYTVKYAHVKCRV